MIPEHEVQAMRGRLEANPKNWLAADLARLLEERETLTGAVERFVSYAREYPEDIRGPLADDFLPQLEALSASPEGTHPERSPIEEWAAERSRRARTRLPEEARDDA